MTAPPFVDDDMPGCERQSVQSFRAILTARRFESVPKAFSAKAFFGGWHEFTRMESSRNAVPDASCVVAYRVVVVKSKTAPIRGVRGRCGKAPHPCQPTALPRAAASSSTPVMQL